MISPLTRARALAGLALFSALSASAAAQVPPTPAQASASGPAPVVRLNVMLTGGRGRAAPELTREDLRLNVDGVERPIVSFAKEELPVSYGLVVDNSGSLKSLLTAVVAAARSVVDSNRAGDEAFVVRFVSSDNIKILQDLTADAAALNGALDSMALEGGQTALLDALHLAGEYLTKNASRTGAPRRRLALLLITDGEDRSSYYKLEQVLKLLRAGGVQVFAVGLTGALADERGFITPSRRERARELLEKLAKGTGGRVFYAEKGGELGEAVGEVVQNMRTQYVLGYEAPAPAGGKGGKVEVRVVGAAAKERLKAVVVPAADGGEAPAPKKKG